MKENSRQRMLNAFNYNNPDKIPVVYHPSTAGLYVHGRKLIDLFQTYPPDNPITHDRIPTLEPGAFDADGNYHEIITDEWGTGWEYRIFGIAGHPKYYPFTSWQEALESYTFPPLAKIGSQVFVQEQMAGSEKRKKYLIFNGWISIFEKLHALRPIDELLMDILTNDHHLLAFIDMLTNYWMTAIDYYKAIGTDVYVVGDDWGMQKSTLISPELFRDIFKPHYKKLFSNIQKDGGMVFLHSCGYMGELLDEFIGLGVRGLWPQLNLYDQDDSFTEKCRENKIAVYLHLDRQRLIPLGTPDQIRRYIAETAEKYHRLGGGGIFYVEIENDAPYENVKALIESIHKYR